jgi:hypothetical protein
LPGYQPISSVAATLQTNEATLLEFHRNGWIQTVRRNDISFLAADQGYRAKYILYLSNVKHLNHGQIQLVLSVQRPPYCAAEVDEILESQARR